MNIENEIKKIKKEMASLKKEITLLKAGKEETPKRKFFGEDN